MRLFTQYRLRIRGEPALGSFAEQALWGANFVPAYLLNSLSDYNVLYCIRKLPKFWWRCKYLKPKVGVKGQVPNILPPEARNSSQFQLLTLNFMRKQDFKVKRFLIIKIVYLLNTFNHFQAYISTKMLFCWGGNDVMGKHCTYQKLVSYNVIVIFSNTIQFILRGHPNSSCAWLIFFIKIEHKQRTFNTFSWSSMILFQRCGSLAMIVRTLAEFRSCKTRLAALLTSSLSWKHWPRSGSFSFLRRSKSGGLRSGHRKDEEFPAQMLESFLCVVSSMRSSVRCHAKSTEFASWLFSDYLSKMHFG